MAGFVALAVVAFVTPSCSQSGVETNSAGEKLTAVTEDDQEMNSAIAQARSSLPQFWAKFDARPAGYSDFQVKPGLASVDDYGTEFIWVDVVERRGDQVIGRLANDPFHLGADMKLGSEVSFKPELISDWGYSKGDVLYGHYTSRVLITRERDNPAEYGLSPTPLETVQN
ncbi:MAG TPA: DUF2314 domain-containing protein [Phenylobacterium sp.]